MTKSRKKKKYIVVITTRQAIQELKPLRRNKDHLILTWSSSSIGLAREVWRGFKGNRKMDSR